MNSWFLVFLVLTGLFLVPSPARVAVAAGFVSPLLGSPPLPGDVDWFLLAGLAAYSGAGGTLNATLTYWLRDKGFGMSGTVASIPALIGGQKVEVSHPGVAFPPTEDNLRRWRGWWRYLRADQGGSWGPGAPVGVGRPPPR